jgi:glycine/D-amino acid oxidase-like deaminating enzyme
VFGGRGAPYLFGSATSGSSGHDATYTALERTLHDLLPQTRDARITHRWGGVLGVPRDWMPAVAFDRHHGVAWGGGYVGDGVALSGLAGRTLADLLLGRDSDETRLPWVGHRWKKWEPEPLRWLGIQAMTAVMASADRVEARTGRPARRAKLLDRLVGD